MSKEERQKIRLTKVKDDAELENLLRDLEQRKEKALRARLEKDQIRRALVDLEKTKLSTLEQERKKELMKLSNERETLRLKEEELLDEINKLSENTKNLDQMRKEEVERLENVGNVLRGKKVENKRFDEMKLQEKSEKVAELKLRREMLEKVKEGIGGWGNGGVLGEGEERKRVGEESNIYLNLLSLMLNLFLFRRDSE